MRVITFDRKDAPFVVTVADSENDALHIDDIIPALFAIKKRYGNIMLSFTSAKLSEPAIICGLTTVPVGSPDSDLIVASFVDAGIDFSDFDSTSKTIDISEAFKYKEDHHE